MKSIRSKLGLATCSLLTQGATATEVIDNAWETDASIIRKQLVKPSVLPNKNLLGIMP